MGIAHRFEKNSSARWQDWLVIPRVILGVLLLIKGISFLSHATKLEEMIAQSQFENFTAFLSVYIIFAHILGGVMIIIGLYTRIACLWQVPILIGALILAKNGNVFSIESSFVFSLMVLLLLLFFMYKGRGQFSMERYLKHHLL